MTVISSALRRGDWVDRYGPRKYDSKREAQKMQQLHRVHVLRHRGTRGNFQEGSSIKFLRRAQQPTPQMRLFTLIYNNTFGHH